MSNEKVEACKRYLGELPSRIKDRALLQLNHSCIGRHDKVDSLPRALWVFAIWEDTFEGVDYWRYVMRRCEEDPLASKSCYIMFRGLEFMENPKLTKMKMQGNKYLCDCPLCNANTHRKDICSEDEDGWIIHCKSCDNKFPAEKSISN